MGDIKVQHESMAHGAAAIHAGAGELTNAMAALRDAQAAGGAFGGEAPGEAFFSAVAAGASALRELESTVDALSQNVAAAAVGYLTTDFGVIPERMLHSGQKW